MKTTDRVYLVVTLLFVLAFGAFLSSCKQASNPSSVQPGSVTGVVSLWDSAGPMPSSAGVTIALDSSNYTTQSDSAGLWAINNVAPGNYNITVSKTGFGLCRAYGVTIEGPGTASVTPEMTFGVASTEAPVISNLAITTADTAPYSNTMLTGAISSWNNNSSGNEDNMPVIFIDLSPNVQPGDTHTLWKIWIPSENINNQFGWSMGVIHQAGITSGTTVYVSASEVNFTSVWHPGGGISSGTYNDPLDNSTRFISPGPKSNVIAATIP